MNSCFRNTKNVVAVLSLLFLSSWYIKYNDMAYIMQPRGKQTGLDNELNHRNSVNIKETDHELLQLYHFWSLITGVDIQVIKQDVRKFTKLWLRKIKHRGQQWNMAHILKQNYLGFDVKVDWSANGETRLTLQTRRSAKQINNDSFSNFNQTFLDLQEQLAYTDLAKDEVEKNRDLYQLKPKENGGARFEIIANGSNHISQCAVTDYYNGSYIAICRHCGPANITVSLAFGDYLQYLYNRVPHWKTIWSGTVNTKSYKSGKTPEYCKKQDCKTVPLTSDAAVSYRYNGKDWDLFLDGCRVPYIDASTENVVKQAAAVVFIGDSHVRGFFLFTLTAFNRSAATDREQKLIKHASWANLNYIWAPRTHDVLRVLIGHSEAIVKHEKNESDSRPFVFVVSSVHHHVSEGGFKEYKDGIEKYFVAVETLIGYMIHLKRLSKKVHFIWLTGPPFPKRETSKLAPRDGLVAAANQWSKIRFQRASIPVVDVYSIIAPVFLHTCMCGHHYTCAEPPNRLPCPLGGKGATLVVINAIAEVVKNATSS